MKNKNGNAYLMVLMVTFTLFIMISTALVVTATSRRLTRRSANFINLYDLATTGNQQVFAKLNYFLQDNCTETGTYYTTQSLMHHLAATGTREAQISNRINNPERRSLYFDWHFNSLITNNNGYVAADSFSATTRISHTTINHATTTNPANCYFYSIFGYTSSPEVFIVRTTIIKFQVAYGEIMQAVVESFIVWDDKNLINCLDYYALAMVRLIRIAD